MLLLNICFTSIVPIVEDENETAIPQCDAEIKVEHHFGTTFYVTEGSRKFTTTLTTCSCGEKGCRHIQAVNNHRQGASRVMIPVRVKCDGIRRLLSESVSNRKYYV